MLEPPFGYDIEKMDKESYKNIYSSFFSRMQNDDDNCYIPLSFFADLYAYAHGMDEQIGWARSIELQKELKKRYPEYCVKTKTGKEKFRFTEDDVYEIIINTGGYLVGGDLIEVLFNFTEYEDDFNIKLPERLQKNVNEYRYNYYEELDQHMTDEAPQVNFDEWLDEIKEIY